MLGRRPGLAHGAVAQHDDAIGDLRHHGKVVRDVDRGRVALAHGLAEGAQHLDLRGDVERGGRLVEDHQLGIGHQRHRRHQPLQLAARDLMGEARADAIRLGQGKGAEDVARLGLGRGARHQTAHAHALRHLIHQAQRGIEGGGSALRHVGDAPAAQLRQLDRRHGRHLLAADAHAAAGDAAAAPGIAQQRQRDRGLARARFADQRQNLAAVDGEADVAHDVARRAAVALGGDMQAGDFDQRHLAHHRRGCGPRSRRSAG